MVNLVRRLSVTCLAFALLHVSGCASNRYSFEQPIMPGNDLVNYEKDLADCKNKVARANEKSSAPLKGAAAGAAVGTASTSGGDLGDMLGGAVIGAAVGALTGDYFENRERRKQVISCMRDLGYNMAD